VRRTQLLILLLQACLFFELYPLLFLQLQVLLLLHALLLHLGLLHLSLLRLGLLLRT